MSEDGGTCHICIAQDLQGYPNNRERLISTKICCISLTALIRVVCSSVKLIGIVGTKLSDKFHCLAPMVIPSIY
jgi:hypothetical protein